MRGIKDIERYGGDCYQAWKDRAAVVLQPIFDEDPGIPFKQAEVRNV